MSKFKSLKTRLRIKFKFEPDQKWWGQATIFPTHRGMLRAIKNDNINASKNTAGLCSNYRQVVEFNKKKWKGGRDTGQICEIYLNEQDLSCEVIAHESAHGCMGWARRTKLFWKSTHGCGKFTREKKGVTWVDEQGERWAYALGRVVEQITLAYQCRLGRMK